MKIFKGIKTKLILALLCTIFMLPAVACAHFGAVIPSITMLDQSHRRVEILFAFTHPFEQHSMELERPQKVGIMNMGTLKEEVITRKLQPATHLGHKAWRIGYKVKRPGVYCIYMIPRPYWEPAEDHYIKHITKAYIAAYGEEEGWEKPLGLETEIVPLTRPFGVYEQNVFRGRVYLNGKPAANSPVEIEYLNSGGKLKGATEYMVTQVVYTDDQGFFCYSPPAAGWWAFSALNTAGYTIKHEGEPKEVELGAVIWVKFLPWPGRK
ncbi:MAG: DUF4198 domain-containing protein [Deltaproteobacteria bacterium]|nr:MAG: DUF4198 domain-containing protein [Deltaproteobacteria bacterium]